MIFLGILLTALFIPARGDNRIAGGSEVSISDYPFAAALLTNRGIGAVFQQVCGGTVLTCNTFLSAASCVHTDGVLDNLSWWRVRIGSELSASAGRVLTINDTAVHPEFNYRTYANDLVILRTIECVLFTDIFQPARIAGSAFTLSAQQSVWAIGWGASSATSGNSPQLRMTQVWIIPQEACASRYYNGLNFIVTDNMVCAGWLDVGQVGQCQGDNGSPLLIDGVVVGVHSRSEDCPDPQYPSINTRLAPYSRWIVSATIPFFTNLIYAIEL